MHSEACRRNRTGREHGRGWLGVGHDFGTSRCLKVVTLNALASAQIQYAQESSFLPPSKGFARLFSVGFVPNEKASGQDILPLTYKLAEMAGGVGAGDKKFHTPCHSCPFNCHLSASTPAEVTPASWTASEHTTAGNLVQEASGAIRSVFCPRAMHLYITFSLSSNSRFVRVPRKFGSPPSHSGLSRTVLHKTQVSLRAKMKGFTFSASQH